MLKQIKMASLKKQIAAAPKYTLLIESVGYLAANQKMTGIIFTQDINEAMIYAVGFDILETKLGIWNAEAKKMFNNSEVVFSQILLEKK